MSDPKTELRIKRMEVWMRDCLLETDEEVIAYTAKRMREDVEAEKFWYYQSRQGMNAIGAQLAHEKRNAA